MDHYNQLVMCGIILILAWILAIFLFYVKGVQVNTVVGFQVQCKIALNS